VSDIERMAALRVNKQKDNSTVTPVDLLRAMASDIETGELKLDGLLLIHVNRPGDSDWSYGTYRCGLTRDQELVALTMAKFRCIKDWRQE